MKFLFTFAFAILLGNADALVAQQPDSVPTRKPLPEIQYAAPAGMESRSKSSYRLADGDVLGIFVEGVLGPSGSTPPVHYQDDSRGLLTSMGYPIPVRNSGKVSLPLIAPISVAGLTVWQAEKQIKKAYIDGQFLNSDSRIFVTLMRKRTINATFLRQDDSFSSRPNGGPSSQAVNNRSDQSQRGFRVQLAEGENSLLNGLIQTGGVPGVNAKAIHIIRESSQGTKTIPLRRTDSRSSSPFPRSSPNRTFQPYTNQKQVWNTGSSPARFRSFDSIRTLAENLREGDVVQVEAKPTELYYTGGMLPGREFALPRDKPLDILEAISIAGGTLSTASVSSGSIQPTALTILRKTGPGQQIRIAVDLRDALSNPALRYQVQAGDYLFLEFQPDQQLMNFGLQTFRTYGLRQLFR